MKQYKWAFNWLGKQKYLLILAIVFDIAGVGLMTWEPYIFKDIVDDVLMPQQFGCEYGSWSLEWGCPSTLPTMATGDWLSTATLHVGTWGQNTWKAEGSSLGLERLLDLPLPQ